MMSPRRTASSDPSEVATAWVSTLGFSAITAFTLLEDRPDGMDPKTFLASLDEQAIATMFSEDSELPQRLAACVWRGIKELRTLEA